MKSKWIRFAKGLLLLMGASVAMVFLHRMLPERRHFARQVAHNEVNVTALFYSEEKHSLDFFEIITDHEMDHPCY